MKWKEAVLYAALFILAMFIVSAVVKVLLDGDSEQTELPTKEQALVVDETPVEEVPDVTQNADGVYVDSNGARYHTNEEDAYHEWYAVATDNCIDNQFKEQYECIQWLCRNHNVAEETVTWVSWYDPADDMDDYDTILIRTDDESEYYVRRHKSPVTYEIVNDKIVQYTPAPPKAETPDGTYAYEHNSNWELSDSVKATASLDLISRLSALVDSDKVSYGLYTWFGSDWSNIQYTTSTTTSDILPDTVTHYFIAKGNTWAICLDDNYVYLRQLTFDGQ